MRSPGLSCFWDLGLRGPSLLELSAASPREGLSSWTGTGLSQGSCSAGVPNRLFSSSECLHELGPFPSKETENGYTVSSFFCLDIFLYFLSPYQSLLEGIDIAGATVLQGGWRDGDQEELSSMASGKTQSPKWHPECRYPGTGVNCPFPSSQASVNLHLPVMEPWTPGIPSLGSWNSVSHGSS